MSVSDTLLPPSDEAPTLVALHFLGGRADLWAPVMDRLSGQFCGAAIDLPGFGSAAAVPGYEVAAMAAHVAAQVRQLAPRRWLLAGHSMGAKVACAVARLAEDGAAGLEGLDGLVLVAGSPPAPEPMPEKKRREMRGWFAGSAEESRRQADGYIRDNVAAALPDEHQAGAVASVLAAHRDAWLAWLDGGSREDWRERIGVLRTPALVLAGGQDAALGAEAQRELMLPHLAEARLHVLPGVAHLLPMEEPAAVAAAVIAFAGHDTAPEPDLPPAYRALIDSPRVSPRTRAILLERAAPVPPQPGLLSGDETRVLRALAARIIPQPGPHRIDIAGRILRRMARGQADGWRFADLPDDATALRNGLRDLDAIARTLDVGGFAFLSGAHQDALLTALGKGELTSPRRPADGALSAHQLKLWFEDMRSVATQIFVAHPVTEARLGYAGIANRGDRDGPAGFVAVGLGARDAWEPLSAPSGVAS